MKGLRENRKKETHTEEWELLVEREGENAMRGGVGTTDALVKSPQGKAHRGGTDLGTPT